MQRFTGDYCTDPTVGYNLDTRILQGFGATRSANIVIKGLAGSLVLNAVAAGFAGLSTVFALLAWCCAQRWIEIVSVTSSPCP